MIKWIKKVWRKIFKKPRKPMPEYIPVPRPDVTKKITLIEGKVYTEPLTLDEDGVTLDGNMATLNAPITITASHVTIKNLRIEGIHSDKKHDTPAGIWVKGGVNDIRIERVWIEDIKNFHRSGNAHGIAVYGRFPIKNVVISECRLTDLVLGSSEAIAINGDVDTFLIEKCKIWNCNNIGIDAIGFEGTGLDKDYARNGLIKENEIWNIHSADNPAYRGRSAAAGIYVDGGKDIVIRDNTVRDCDMGIELASEHGGELTEKITVMGNKIENNLVCGLAMGGYEKDKGGAERCLIKGNLFEYNNTRKEINGEIWLQYNLKNNAITHNKIRCNDSGNFIYMNDRKGDFMLNRNEYRGPIGRQFFRWRGKSYHLFKELQEKTANELNGEFIPE